MKYVLFVCTQNAGRSQIAQAFFERHEPDDVRAESAGAEPAVEIHPIVVEAMKEVDIDLSGRRPKRLTLEMQLHADWAVTLACGAKCPFVPSVVEDWDIDDSSSKPIEEVRQIRDEIEERVKDLTTSRLEGDPRGPASAPASDGPAGSRSGRRVRRATLRRGDPPDHR